MIETCLALLILGLVLITLALNKALKQRDFSMFVFMQISFFVTCYSVIHIIKELLNV